MFHNKKIFVGNFDFPTESLMTKKVIFEKFRKKIIQFEASPVFHLKKLTVIMNRMSFNTTVKINLIQAKIKKVIGHEVHQQNSIYWMLKIATKNNFDRPEN